MKIDVERVDIVVVPGRQLDALEYGYEGPANFTCDGCSWRAICNYAYDYYSTNGDCLASK